MIGKNNIHTACEGKTAFVNRNIAERVAREMNKPHRMRNRRDGKAPAHVYRCPFCGDYHISGSKRMKIEVREG